MNLSLRHMKAFSALASLRSFTRAAEHCNLTQSAFSALIANLERGLGLRLFSRSTRNVELTAEGERFSEIVAQLMPELERALDEMRDHAHSRKGRVAIAGLPTICSALLPPIIYDYMREHPDLDFVIEDVPNADCIELVRNKQVDIALCASVPDSSDLVIEKLAFDSFYFVCRSDHPLSRRKFISQKEAVKHPIIVFEKASSIREHLDAAIYPEQWERAFEVNNLSTAAALVETGLSATIVPGLALCRFAHPDIRIAPLTLAVNQRPICLVRRKDGTESLAAKAFSEILRRHLAGRLRDLLQLAVR